MKLPLTIIKKYKTQLSKEEIFEIINSQENEKLFGGMRVDKFYCKITNNTFQIYRESYGIDALAENYPLITSKIINENPTKLELEIKPNYFDIAFFSLFVIVFISGAIFADEINVNDFIKNPPEIKDRLLLSLGGIIPGIWCYFGYIRPIMKTEKWIVEKFNLKVV